MIIQFSKESARAENHISITNATWIELKISSPCLLPKTMCERLFLKMSPVKHIVEKGGQS